MPGSAGAWGLGAGVREREERITGGEGGEEARRAAAPKDWF